MNIYLKGALSYWLAACILAGAAEGNWSIKCPNDPPTPAVEWLVGIITLPAIIGYALTGPRPPYSCKVK